MKKPERRSNGAGLGETTEIANPSCPVSTDYDAWRLQLQRLEPMNLPLLAIGPGGDGKAPADPKTGQNLKGWKTAAHTPVEVAGACTKIGAVGFRPGPDAGGLIAFDIDGATAVALLKDSRCDPLKAQTWQIRRNTAPDRLKVVWRVPEDLLNHLPRRISKLVSKPPSARGVADGENVATYYGAGQVVILGNHRASGGHYFWPERHGPEALAEIPPDWWRMALEIAEAEPAPAASNSSTGNTGRGDWRRLDPCPICGRPERLICSKHRDGLSILCFHGGTYCPPELKPGEVITGSDGERWAFTSSRRHGDIGDFSHFKIDDPRERSKASSYLVDGLHVIEESENGPEPRQDRQQKPSGEPESLTYSELIAVALEAISNGQRDQEMLRRAEIMNRYRRSDAQVTKELIDALTHREGGNSRACTYGAVDLGLIAGMDWLVEGFIPERDQVLLYGEAGAGKTTAAVGLAFAVLEGTGYLDRASAAKRGSVLFIASDSGADPLKSTLQGMGLLDHPALSNTSEHRLIVWAHDADQGRMAWDASLPGLMHLLKFVQSEGVVLVVIDSAKAVTSKADLNYCDNGQVTALLTFVKEVICRFCSVVWLHHDGTNQGTAAGAKAWKEIPSSVQSIEHVEMDGSRGGPRNQPCHSERMRWWKVKKCRLNTARELRWELDEASGRPALIPGAARTIVEDARAGIVEVMWQAWQDGRRTMSRKELVEAQREQFAYSSKTTDNTLGRMVQSQHPEVCRLSSPRGHYKLAPRVVETLTAAQTAGAPLNPSCSDGKEQGKNSLSDRDVGTSREVPEGTQGNKPQDEVDPPDFPREMLGKTPPTSGGNGSANVPSREITTSRACEEPQAPDIKVGSKVCKCSPAEERHLPGWEVQAIEDTQATVHRSGFPGWVTLPIERLRFD